MKSQHSTPTNTSLLWCLVEIFILNLLAEHEKTTRPGILSDLGHKVGNRSLNTFCTILIDEVYIRYGHIGV